MPRLLLPGGILKTDSRRTEGLLVRARGHDWEGLLIELEKSDIGHGVDGKGQTGSI